MARHREPEYCNVCGKQLEAIHRNIPGFVGDTFSGYKPCKHQPTHEVEQRAGMRWVNSRERLPEIDDLPVLDDDYSERKFVCRFEENIINGFDIAGIHTARQMREIKYPGHWEWLDESLQEGAKSAQGELEQLRQWKREAIEVMPDLQAIGKALDIPLGQSVHDKILPKIEQLKAAIDHLSRQPLPAPPDSPK